MKRLRVLLADDHDVVRKGLRYLLSEDPGIEVVGEASDGREAVGLAEQLKPDVLVIDIAMPHLNGVQATAQITKRDPKIAVVILTMYTNEVYLTRALDAGARGYLLKDSVGPDLLRAVRSVTAGKPFFSSAVTHTILEDYVRRIRQENVQDSYDLLTDREKEVLQLLAEGKSNKEAAALLAISPTTVETHRTHLMQKLDLHNTADIVLYAVRKKIIATE
jgi:two-component system, NarL family, response regulator NreC